MLRQIADYVEKESVTTKEVKHALMYPVMTSIVSVVVIVILAIFVLPAFGKLYTSLGIEMPTLFRLLVAFISKIQEYGLFVALGIFLIALALLYYVKSPSGKYKWDRMVLSLPLIGRVKHLSELARYCRGMSLLFRAGLPLTEAISLVVQGSGNSAMAKALSDVQEDMVQGEGLSKPMVKNHLFLPMMVQMIKVGEETGNLDVTLQAVAQSYEGEAEDTTRTLVSLIQPAMTVVMGQGF
jgi:type IV pilus assembly protein PilC